MRRTICRQCPKLRNCELDPRSCNRNDVLHNFLKHEINEILFDLHNVFTEIEDDGDE